MHLKQQCLRTVYLIQKTISALLYNLVMPMPCSEELSACQKSFHRQKQCSLESSVTHIDTEMWPSIPHHVQGQSLSPTLSLRNIQKCIMNHESYLLHCKAMLPQGSPYCRFTDFNTQMA